MTRLEIIIRKVEVGGDHSFLAVLYGDSDPQVRIMGSGLTPRRAIANMNDRVDILLALLPGPFPEHRVPLMNLACYYALTPMVRGGATIERAGTEGQ